MTTAWKAYEYLGGPQEYQASKEIADIFKKKLGYLMNYSNEDILKHNSSLEKIKRYIHENVYKARHGD